MQVTYELVKVLKDNITYYLLKSYIVYDSGKRFNYNTLFLKKSQYIKLGGKD